MESFQQMVPQRAKVLRDSERKELLATELVVGDIVLLETGDRVPADIRILECQGEVSCHRITRGFLVFFRWKNKPFSSRELTLRTDSQRFLILFDVSSKESPELLKLFGKNINAILQGRDTKPEI